MHIYSVERMIIRNLVRPSSSEGSWQWKTSVNVTRTYKNSRFQVLTLRLLTPTRALGRNRPPQSSKHPIRNLTNRPRSRDHTRGRSGRKGSGLLHNSRLFPRSRSLARPRPNVHSRPLREHPTLERPSGGDTRRRRGCRTLCSLRPAGRPTGRPESGPQGGADRGICGLERSRVAVAAMHRNTDYIMCLDLRGRREKG